MEIVMQYRSIKLPTGFLDEVECFANIECRSIAQQIMFWTKLGKQNDSQVAHEKYLKSYTEACLFVFDKPDISGSELDSMFGTESFYKRQFFKSILDYLVNGEKIELHLSFDEYVKRYKEHFGEDNLAGGMARIKQWK